MKPVFFETQTGRRTALVVTEGRKFNHLIVMDCGGLTITKVPSTVELKVIERCKDPLAKFQSAAKQFGCTKTAAVHLGLKTALPKPSGENVMTDNDKTEKKAPVRKGTGAKGKGKARKPKAEAAAKAETPAKKRLAKAEKAVARNTSRDAFIKHWNEFANGDVKELATAINRMDKVWEVGPERAEKRFKRIARELNVDTSAEKPQPVAVEEAKAA